MFIQLGEVGDDLAGTVIYGGKYNAYDTDLHGFLNDEYRWIEKCLRADVPILGICQGAQMLARHLGAGAGPTETEIFEFGYYRIDPAPEAAGPRAAPLGDTGAFPYV